MKRIELWTLVLALFAVLLVQAWAARAGEVNLNDYDHQGRKLYLAEKETTETNLTADSGGRTLAGFYELRQYPGSPPRIPHPVDLTVGPGRTDCLACHEQGGYSPEYGKFVPVTPHPENTLCYQCHLPITDASPLVNSTWQSIDPPRLGLSFLASSPPTIPHSLQLRENCVACHTGPAAVAEIRVSHASRGDCRQCHVPAVQTEAMREFTRGPAEGQR